METKTSSAKMRRYWWRRIFVVFSIHLFGWFFFFLHTVTQLVHILITYEINPIMITYDIPDLNCSNPSSVGFDSIELCSFQGHFFLKYHILKGRIHPKIHPSVEEVPNSDFRSPADYVPSLATRHKLLKELKLEHNWSSLAARLVLSKLIKSESHDSF